MIVEQQEREAVLENSPGLTDSRSLHGLDARRSHTVPHSQSVYPSSVEEPVPMSSVFVQTACVPVLFTRPQLYLTREVNLSSAEISRRKPQRAGISHLTLYRRAEIRETQSPITHAGYYRAENVKESHTKK